MNKMTKEHLKEILERVHSARVSGGIGVTRDEGEEMVRMLLTVMEQDPLGYVDAEYATLLRNGHIESCRIYAEPSDGFVAVTSGALVEGS